MEVKGGVIRLMLTSRTQDAVYFPLNLWKDKFSASIVCYSTNTLECTLNLIKNMGLPWWYSGWTSTCQCRGRRFNPWSRKIPRATEQLSLCTTAHVLQLLKPACLDTCPTGKKKPLQGEAHALQLERRPCSLQLDKTHVQQWRPSVTRNK